MDIISKTVDASVDNLYEVLGFIEENLEAHNASMKDINVISVAAEEMYANIAMYAYQDSDNPKEATIEMEFVDDSVIITFIDSGMPFNPLAKEDPDVHAKAEDRGIGGLGIYMVKKSMNECKYEYKDSKNIFSMRKVIKQW